MIQVRGLIAIVDRGARYIGLGLILLGAMACIAPLMSGLALAVILGLVLLGAGALVALFGRRAREAGKGNLALIIGAVAAICGLLLVVQPSAGLSVVRWILIPYMLISGASEAGLALRLRPDHGWAETLGGAAISILVALILLCDWPISGARAVGLLVGVKLIASGWAIMRVHRAIESATRRLQSAKQVLAQRSAP